MSPTPAISRFTPSLMEHALLERLFVARDGVIDDVMRRVVDAAATDGRNHTLLVGPRGAGKTHLITLAYHRTRALIAAGARLRVSWLPEDPWTLIAYRHLLAAIVSKLEPAVEDPPKDADDLERLIVERAREHGPIVVFVENLDQILDNLGEIGQQKLRHLLQAERSLLLVASTTRLDRSLSDQASPFYGFFTTTKLEPFVVREAAEMLTRIAEEKGDEDLVAYLASDEGKARLQTAAHLAGGQPRIWAALAAALTVSGLDELVELLLVRFDDLTPYYQEQLARLAPQQRLVVAELAEADRPINVKDLAERLDIDQRSLGKTMVELVERGWVRPTTSPYADLLDRRKTFYELAEPMARLAFQIKESRGKPIRLIIDFLKFWFDPERVHKAAKTERGSYWIEVNSELRRDPTTSVARMLGGLPDTDAPSLELLAQVDDALAHLEARNAEPLFRLPHLVRTALEGHIAGLSVFDARLTIHERAGEECGRTPNVLIEEWTGRAQALVEGRDGEDLASGWLMLADWLGRAWQFEPATTLISMAEEQLGSSDLELIDTKLSHAHSRWAAGRTDEAIEIEEALVDLIRGLRGEHDRLTFSAMSSLAGSYWQAGRTDEALAIDEALAQGYSEMLGPDHRATLGALIDLASSYWDLGRADDAIDLQEQVLARATERFGEHDSDVTHVTTCLANSYATTGKAREAIDLLEAALERIQGSTGVSWTQRTWANQALAFAYFHDGQVEQAIALQTDVVHSRADTLGPSHPTTHRAAETLRDFFCETGRRTEAGELGRRFGIDVA